MAVDPQTPAQWQEAVDAASGALLLDAARAYGFVTGGPEIDIDRCEDILERGKSQGFTPSTDAIERFVAALTKTEVA